MSPKPRANDVKERLVEAAIRLIGEGGPEALQARKLAAEVGVSTMAVYTHFGGMAALVDEVARTGFLRLSAWLAEVGETDDPVADIFSLARTYRQAVAEQPQLYAVTFGQSTPGRQARDAVGPDHRRGPRSRARGPGSLRPHRPGHRAGHRGRPVPACRQVPGGRAAVERAARLRHPRGLRPLRRRRAGHRPHFDTPGDHPRGRSRGHCGEGGTFHRGREGGLAREKPKRRAGWERLTRRTGT